MPNFKIKKMEDKITLSINAILGEEQADGGREANIEIVFNGTISDVTTLLLQACEKHMQIKASILIAANFLESFEDKSIQELMVEELNNIAETTSNNEEIQAHNLFNNNNKYEA